MKTYNVGVLGFGFIGKVHAFAHANLPFFFAALLPSITIAYYASMAMALVALFGLGVYLGTVSSENRTAYGIKTMIAGIVCMGVTLLIELISR